jgi:hypothetical protein
MALPERAQPFISQTKVPLRHFPNEVKAMIYKYAYREARAGKTPPLLAALRSEKDLYHHATKA